MAWIAFVLVFLAGFLYVLAGLFGDLSGEHRIFVLALVIGIVMMVLAVAGAIRLRRTKPGAAPASPERQQ
jgi:hypothetical protein